MPAQLGDLEWWSVAELLEYWRDHPPVHELVAAYLGVKPRSKLSTTTASADDPSGIGGLVAQFPNGFVPANRPG